MSNDINLSYNHHDMSDIYKLRDWIYINNINWNSLSYNPNAIHLLQQNMDKINWDYLSANPKCYSYIRKKFK